MLYLFLQLKSEHKRCSVCTQISTTLFFFFFNCARDGKFYSLENICFLKNCCVQSYDDSECWGFNVLLLDLIIIMSLRGCWNACRAGSISVSSINRSQRELIARIPNKDTHCGMFPRQERCVYMCMYDRQASGVFVSRIRIMAPCPLASCVVPAVLMGALSSPPVRHILIIQHPCWT